MITMTLMIDIPSIPQYFKQSLFLLELSFTTDISVYLFTQTTNSDMKAYGGVEV
jgi:hypothetical protein